MYINPKAFASAKSMGGTFSTPVFPLQRSYFAHGVAVQGAPTTDADFTNV